MQSRAARKLSRGIVIDAAEALVDRDGWWQFTMVGLASKLGVRVPSLYSHVESAEAVLSEVQVRAHAALANQLQRAAMGKSGKPAFRALAEVFRTFASSHGGLYDLAMSEPIDRPAVLAAAEPSAAALAAVVESFGIAEPTLELQMTCVAALHGVIVLDRARTFSGAVDVAAAYDRAVVMVLALLEDPGHGHRNSGPLK